MLRRTHVQPFLRYVPDRAGPRPRVGSVLDDGGEDLGTLQVDYLTDPRNVVRPFLARVLRLMRRLEGSSRRTVEEALRRQQRRVRDARRMDGLARTILSLSRFRAPDGAHRAAEVRRELHERRGEWWPPVPGDEGAPYQAAAEALAMTPGQVRELLFADDPGARILVRAPRLSAAALLHRYNVDLARGVLLDAVEMEVEAGEGWRDLFRMVKLARLMHEIHPVGAHRFRISLTGPAAPYVLRPQRYGIRLARVVLGLARTRGWTAEARVLHEGRPVPYRLSASGPLRPRRVRRPRFDSGWEEDLAQAFAEKLGSEREGWILTREDVPVQVGGRVFLPDFTVRHRDGRVALVEIVGFWTPEYLDEKLRKLREAGLHNLVVVVFRGLAAGRDEASQGRLIRELAALPGEVTWFTNRVRIGPLMAAVERVAHRPVGE
ncbi:MAG: DUF790 family protein [Gemmatimonadales bacterium]|nr:MAG: DUF790 family protein [Gemmatimonadales bacterium]